ncbi:oxygen-regulated protein 1-like [Sparus aurata]|uniref:oxygen-regulated protein 1-like n=1 Tax=Sparus aurata TaxID=8175 RepID=UPI0011C0E8A1|nr:oxygen-regulated protein 1-like [Sparus aurata]
MMANHEPPEECYLCSEYRHAQALEALETQVTPLYHSHAPYHHHHPHQYVLRRPEEHPVAHSGYNRHLHHHRYNKRVVLVKNSDPSFRKTIVLHRRSLRSFGLFLEEVSELMQYHVRKLYTLEGRKIDNVQSLMQCPSFLVCVGREPSHPSFVENFRKTSDDKLPKLNVRSSSSGCNEGVGGVPTKKSDISPKLESDPMQSLSSDKSLQDGTDSLDNVDSRPRTGDGLREDDIEKRVRVNKDGSLSMEMKVRFRLQNDETLHWSTKVRKTGNNTEYLQGNSNPYFAQVSDRSYSESENLSAGEQDKVYMKRHYQRHTEEPHCPQCCSQCQGYDIWKNDPEAHGAKCSIQTSSSSASSHTMLSRKTVVERRTMSRSSEDHTEQVLERETCVEQTVEEAETVEYCIIRSEACSPKSSTLDNCEVCVVKTAQTPEAEEPTGSDADASSVVLTDDDEGADVPLSAASAVSDAASPVQHLPLSPTDGASNASGSSSSQKWQQNNKNQRKMLKMMDNNEH